MSNPGSAAQQLSTISFTLCRSPLGWRDRQATIVQTAMIIKAIRMPGSVPARNSFPTDVPETDA